jgi:hypothetical protein
MHLAVAAQLMPVVMQGLAEQAQPTATTVATVLM